MSSAFGLAGYYFGGELSVPEPLPIFTTNLTSPLGRKPTSANSESQVAEAPNSKPWEIESSGSGNASGQFKYQYHPGGNPKNAPKDAPSALNVVVVPNVNLPKVGPKALLDGITCH